jgi:hypothetical protein
LSARLDRVVDVREAMMLVSLHSQNAARLGKLMLNKKALQKDAEDPFQQVLNEVLDELTEELDLKLGSPPERGRHCEEPFDRLRINSATKQSRHGQGHCEEQSDEAISTVDSK